jgi:hypothetical protein
LVSSVWDFFSMPCSEFAQIIRVHVRSTVMSAE